MYDICNEATKNKEESEVGYYGISPYEKSMNNMPFVQFTENLQLGDTLIFSYDPTLQTFSIQSKERRFDTSIRYIPKTEIYRPVFWLCWKD